MALRFEASISGTPLGVRTVRHALAVLAQDCGMDADGIADVRLAVTEAATNAVIHAYAESEGEIEVMAAARHGELSIVIRDTGAGLVERPGSPGLGVGLAVIATIVRRLDIVSRPRGTEIHMAFPCPNAD